jgi:hypothetical protein
MPYNKPNSTGVVRENYAALNAFYEFCGGRDAFEEYGIGHRAEVMVIYQYAGKVIRQATTAVLTFSGYGTAGSIELEPRGKLDLEKQHLGFSADFQSYNFDAETGVLTVTDSSPKTNGPYKVEIIVVG